MSDDIIHLVGGIDVGNGYVKALVADSDLEGTDAIDEIDMPSAVVSTSRSVPKVPVPDSDALAQLGDGEEGDDFYNRLDASLTSPLVAVADRRIYGRAALSFRGSKFTEFEVLSAHSKADQELSKVLVLGVFAAKALRDHVRAHGSLPDHELQVEVSAGLALPITEYVARRAAYAAEFTGSVHLVTIKNFATPVSVRLRFTDVQVMAEGASAQFAITDKGEPLAALLLADLRSREPGALEGVTAADLVAVQNTVGVDVGEGTTNFPCFSAGRFNAEASATLNSGYGTALVNAMERMSESDPTLQFSSRKQLADFLAHRPSPLQRGRWDRAQGYVIEESHYLVSEIVSAFTDVLAQAGATTEAVYVYGGGAGPIKEMLHPALLEAAGDIPVLYLDSRYSRHLNREGLYLMASALRRAATTKKGSSRKNDPVAA
ncbi:hypothetical protein [Acidipropionibacterium jensenii]|uniref:hypothetical protein n=1 Tax=Acidipropionibacterium jensenii TaxID=1749 RepID=UPI00214B5008|nr:hypothetical protein [Acidipropionibacterium jensenii]